jgi:hypothetical protein
MPRVARIPTVLLVFLVPLAAGAVEEEKVEGYCEWQKGNLIIVDGQHVRPASNVEYKKVGRLYDIQLGYEVKAKGTRSADGTLVAREIEAKPNGNAMFESEVLEATNEVEQVWVSEGRMFEPLPDGRTKTIGKIVESGPRVNRVRSITTNLAPPYVSSDSVRVRVVETDEWNAAAMGNGAIWVYSGLIDSMSDDELAIVLGHELAHYTHEHSRRNAKRGMWTQLLAVGAIAGSEAIDDDGTRTAAQVGSLLGLSAFGSGYSRDLEDQADRVGLRYVYEAGYDVHKGPTLWAKFRDKYGESDSVQNFFFGSHSRPTDRIRNIDRELALNYSAQTAKER